MLPAQRVVRAGQMNRAMQDGAYYPPALRSD
jgi:hypothetical protein